MFWLAIAGLAVLAVAVAIPAHATIQFAMPDLCLTDTTSDPHYFTTGAGTVTVSTSTVDSAPGDACSLAFAVPSGTPTWRGIDIGATSSVLVAGFKVNCASAPTTPREILSFTDGTDPGLLLTTEADGTGYKLRLFYESADTDAGVGECAASATMDGTECGGACSTVADCADPGTAACTASVCVDDCDEINPGEATCAAGQYAATGTLAFGTWYTVMARQDNTAGGAGDVSQTLWQGSAGTFPEVFQRGTGVRAQGICAGGDNDNYACSADSDCPASTCTVTDVIAVDQVRWGATDSRTGAFTCYLAGIMVDDADANPNYRIETLLPDGEGAIANKWGATGCSSPNTDDCVDDPAATDGHTTRLESKSAGCCSEANDSHDLTIAALAAPTPAPTPLAVAVAVAAQDKDGGITLDGELWDSSANKTTVYTPFALTDFSDSGASGPFHVMPPLIATSAPDAGAWTTTKVNDVRVHLEKTAGGATEGRVTKVAVGVVQDLPDPVLPAVLPDRDSDGADTVAIIGDSTLNDPGFYPALVAGLLEPTNLYDCARGGATAGDVTDSIDDILAGATTQHLACTAQKGATAADVDVAVVTIGINTFASPGFIAPEHAVADDGVDQMGYCDDRGGGDEGAVCYCPQNSHRVSTSILFGYSRAKGTSWQTPCFVQAPCSKNADCCTSGDDVTCTDTVGTCTGGFCAAGFDCAVDGASASLGGMCAAGCLGATGCADGICVSQNRQATMRQEIAAIEAAVAAYSTPAPLLVWGTPPPAQVGSLKCNRTANMDLGALRNYLRTKDRWIDLYGIFERDVALGLQRSCASPGNCTATEDATLCYRDGLHWTTFCQEIAAEAFIACLTNDNETRTHDGVCSGGTCTDGKIGDTCSADADCDLWRCSFS